MIRHSLFIFNFSRKKCKAVFLILAAVILFMTLVKALNYLYWQEDVWCRNLWHNFYGQAKNIDYIYLGSSHVYCDINPEILDEKNGKNNFNLSSGSQRVIESYYCLKEADRRNKIEKVYLELYYVPSTGAAGNYQDKSSIQNGWRNTDYMKPSFCKTEAIFGMNPLRYYPEAVFPFIRYREHLEEGDWIKGRVDEKSSENYKNYIYHDGTTEYRDKGYYYTTRELTNLLFARDRIPGEMSLTEDAEKYLRKIIEYCQEKDISITLFSSPIYEIQPLSTENYDSYANGVKEIAAEYGVAYYDFNLVKEEYLSVQYPEYYMDVGHLNGKGAELFTYFFHQVVSSEWKENKKYFYNSYSEKLEKSKERVYGLYSYGAGETELEPDDPDKTQRMVIASNRDKELEYQVFMMPDEGETVLLQNYSTNKQFNISPQEHGICKIVWRSTGDKEKTKSMEVRY